MRARVVFALFLLTLLFLSGCIDTSSPQAKEPAERPQWQWADPDAATIFAGMPLDAKRDGMSCLTGFVVTGLHLYISAPYSCLGGAVVGDQVHLPGAIAPATLAYMYSTTPDDGRTDFALLRINAADWEGVSPGLPIIGGPSEVATPASVAPQEDAWLASKLHERTGFAATFVTFSDPPHELEVADARPVNPGGPVVTMDGAALGLRSGVPGREPGTEVLTPLWLVLKNARLVLDEPLEVATAPWQASELKAPIREAGVDVPEL